MNRKSIRLVGAACAVLLLGFGPDGGGAGTVAGFAGGCAAGGASAPGGWAASGGFAGGGIRGGAGHAVSGAARRGVGHQGNAGEEKVQGDHAGAAGGGQRDLSSARRRGSRAREPRGVGGNRGPR